MNVAHHLFQSDSEVRKCLGDFIVHRRSDGNYLERLVIVWNEKRVIDFETQNIQHIFAFGIDRKNQVYIDCRKRLIYAKILVSTLFRPIHAVLLVSYQLSMIPIFKAISSAYSKEITASEAFKRSFRSIADIVRVPLYELAMIVTGCAALLIAPFAPTTLYRFRELIGKIEKAMFYGVQRHDYTLTPCFQSRSLKGLVALYGFEKPINGWSSLSERVDTDYGNYRNTTDALNFFAIDPESNQVIQYRKEGNVLLSEVEKMMFQKTVILRSLMHFERACIRHLRHVERLSPNGAYRSFAIDKIHSEEIERIRSFCTLPPSGPQIPLRTHPPVSFSS